MGDSGYIHIRDGLILSESISQTHYFNCPFQLSLKTPNESSISDNPEKADFYKIEELLPQDVLIFATDGLFDNLPLDYLSKIISNSKMSEENLKEKMVEITNLCLTIALDDKFLSPFAIEARKEGYTREVGGKMDDMTVIINLIH